MGYKQHGKVLSSCAEGCKEGEVGMTGTVRVTGRGESGKGKERLGHNIHHKEKRSLQGLRGQLEHKTT